MDACALSRAESSALSAHETTIERGLSTFYDVGSALLAIRDGKLYRRSHGTFEAYCKERWNIKRQRAYELMQAAEAATDVGNLRQPPATESQAAELAAVPKESRAEVWQQAVESAPIGTNGEPKVTAKHVEATVERWNAPPEDEIEDDDEGYFDELDQPVPPKLVAVFQDAELIDQAIGHAKALLKVSVELSKSPAGKFLNLASIRSVVKTACAALESTRPFALCPYCDGRKCSACGKVGVVPKEVHQQAQKEG